MSQALKLLVPVLNLSHREYPNFVCRSKVIYLSFSWENSLNELPGVYFISGFRSGGQTMH